jgi:hypothetical protein
MHVHVCVFACERACAYVHGRVSPCVHARLCASVGLCVHAGDGWTSCNVQRAADIIQLATCNVQRGGCAVQG